MKTILILINIYLIIFISTLLYLLNSHVEEVFIPQHNICKAEPQKNARLREFLNRKHSPLVSCVDDLISIPQAHNLNYRLIVGIAGAESGFETAGDTADYNPFGYDCTGSKPCRKFDSYTSAINTLVDSLAGSSAYAKFRETGNLQDLARRYTCGKEETIVRWTGIVERVMEQL